MTAVNFNKKVKLEPSVPIPLISSKKHVKIKLEPNLIRSKPKSSIITNKPPHFSNNDPKTPSDKLISNESLSNNKVAEKPSSQVLSKSGIDLEKASKFLLNVDMDDSFELGEDSTKNTTPSTLATLNDRFGNNDSLETPTKKRSRSQDEGHRLNHIKKVKALPNESKVGDSSHHQVKDLHIAKPNIKPTTNSNPIVEAPKKFTPVTVNLIEGSTTAEIKTELPSYEDLFKDIEDSSIKKLYLQNAMLGSDDWISEGFRIMDDQSRLVQKIVVIRFELSYKFDTIFKVINKYGESLEQNDTELNAKMTKLQKLGEEIKNFIK